MTFAIVDDTLSRRAEPRLACAIACLWLAVMGCSPQVLVVVDPPRDGACAGTGCVSPGLLDGVIGFWRLDDGRGAPAPEMIRDRETTEH